MTQIPELHLISAPARMRHIQDKSKNHIHFQPHVIFLLLLSKNLTCYQVRPLIRQKNEQERSKKRCSQEQKKLLSTYYSLKGLRIRQEGDTLKWYFIWGAKIHKPKALIKSVSSWDK